MKKLIFALLPLLMWMFAACTNELDDKFENLPTYNYRFTAKATDEPDTRVSFDADTREFEWTKGDQVMLLYAPNVKSGIESRFSAFENNGTSVPFVAEKTGPTSDFSGSSTTDLGQKKALYDYKALFPFKEGAPVSGEGISYTIPARQNAVFDPSYCLMYAEVNDAPAFDPSAAPGSNPSFTFNNLLTHVAFYAKDLIGNAPADFKIKGFEIEFPEGKDIVGEITVNPYGDGIKIENVKTGNKATLTFDTPVTAVEAFTQENAAILTCLPFDLAENESFHVTVLGETPSIADMRQNFSFTAKNALSFPAGHFRKINVSLRQDFQEVITPVGGTSIQDMLGDPNFAPVADESNYKDLYGQNGNLNFKQPEGGKVVTAASRVWSVGNEGTDVKDNVIILDNTVLSRWAPLTPETTQSAFYMPTNTVLPNFYEEDYDKDLEVTFKAYILLGGEDINYKNSTKKDVPLMIAFNHCNNSTAKGTDSGFRLIETVILPKENVHYSKKDIPNEKTEGYPAVPVHGSLDKNGNPQPGWVEYKVTVPATKLIQSDFQPNNNGTPAYIGFKIDDFGTSGVRTLLYLKDIEFSAVNRRPAHSCNWMKDVDGQVLLSDMSLPGAHDAATGLIANDLKNASYKCQFLTLNEMMMNGIRVLDLRPTATAELMMNHGSVSTGITFGKAINDIETFLNKYPQETIIVTIKNENGAEEDYKKHMGNYIAANRDRKNAAGQPLFAEYRAGLKLNDVRGKILLLSRNEYNGNLLGGRIKQWSNDTQDDKTSFISTKMDLSIETEKLNVQDFFSGIHSTENKRTAIDAYLDFANGPKLPGEWLFNYLSMSQGATNSPQDNAVTFNTHVAKYLESKPNGCRTGVIFMDFAGQPKSQGDKLLQLIIKQNTILHPKK